MTTVADIQNLLNAFIIVSGVAYTAFIFVMTRRDEREQERDQHQ